MDPDLSETLGMKIFDRVFSGAEKERLFFDEVVWLPQLQECPETGYSCCPDCNGTGDLRNARGKFSDTRLFPSSISHRNSTDMQQAVTAYEQQKEWRS